MASIRDVSVPVLIGGISTGVDRRHVQPGGMVKLENCVVRKGGRISKRKGFDPITTLGMPSNPRAIFPVDGKLVVAGQPSGSITRDTTTRRWDGDSWEEHIRSEKLTMGKVEEQIVIGQVDGELSLGPGTGVDGVYHRGHDFTCAIQHRGSSTARSVFAQIRDQSGSLIFDEEYPGSNAKWCVSSSGNFVILVVAPTTSGTNPSYYLFNVSSGVPNFPPSSATLSAINMDNNHAGYFCFDVAAISGDTFAIAFVEDSTLLVKLYLLTLSGPDFIRNSTYTAASKSGRAQSALVACAYNSSRDTILLAYEETFSSRIGLTTYDDSSPIFSSETLLTSAWSIIEQISVTPEGSPDDFHLAVSARETSNAFATRTYGVDSATVVTARDTFGGSLLTEPFRFGSTGPGTDGPPYIVHNLGNNIGNGRGFGLSPCVGRASEVGVAAEHADIAYVCGQSGINRALAGAPAKVTQESGVFYFYLPVAWQAQRESGAISYLYGALRCSFEPYASDAPPRLSRHDGTLIGSGSLNLVDRNNCRELYTPCAAYIWITSQASSGFVSIDAGEERLVAVRGVWTDSFGNAHFGPISNLAEFTGTSNDSSAGINLYLVSGASEDSAEVYRSLPAETSLYRSDIEFGIHSTLIVDNNDDDLAIQDNPLLSTAEIQPSMPYAITSIFEASDRVWLITSRGAYYSKLQQPGVGVEFSEAFRIVLPGGTPPSAGGDLDGVPIVFSASEAFAVAGQGPDNNGANGDFVAQRITADVGCTHPRSVVSTPLGIMFLSSEGFRLLDRSRQIARTEIGYWGSEANDYAGLNIMASIVRQDENEVIWFTDEAANGTNAIVYNFEFDVWSTWSLPFQVQDATIVGSTLYLLDTSGVIHEEQPDHYDDGVWVNRMLEFADISLNGLEGYQVCRSVALSLRQANGVGGWSFDIDRNDVNTSVTWEQTTDFPLVSLVDLHAIECTVRSRLARQTRMQLRIRETDPGLFTIQSALGNGAGQDILGLRFDVGILPGGPRLDRGERG